MSDDYNVDELAAGRLTPSHLSELVSRFQAAEGMPIDGKAGPRVRAMLELLRGRESGGAAPAIEQPKRRTDVSTVPIMPPRALAPLAVGSDGLLVGRDVSHLLIHPSRYYPALRTSDLRPKAIVAHYTATDPGTAVTMAKHLAGPFKDGERAVSWHLSIEADGSIVQMAPFTAGCWHAGGKTALPVPGIGPANRSSVGIELVGYGDVFPSAQVDAACRVWRALVRFYGIAREHAMVTHQELDPTRKRDPGPVWMSQHAPRVLAYAFE